MRSAAHLKGHPIHPALIPFPLAFLTGAFVFDVLGRLLDRQGFAQTGQYLGIAGVLGALAAAVPGFIDYVRVVPPHSSGKERATKHMALNLATVAVFATAAVLRWGDVGGPSNTVLVLEAFGVAMLSTAGWLGGVLVSRNQISVDHRYADAGKWNERTIRVSRGKPVVVAGVDELEVGQMRLLHVNDKRIVLARTERGYAAFADGCTHKGGPLSDGALVCDTVQCPWHGSQFDVHTGAVKAGPAGDRIETYTVRERDGQVFLEL
jgi:nitrite reductase/ring-hydroxylating ferredoxin subunit/uncharacterized membrane protein